MNATKTRKLTKAYILSDGKVISHKQLMGARINGNKAGESSEIKDGRRTQGTNKFVEPPFRFEDLARLLIRNTTHYRATKAKASDAALRGWFLEAATDVENPSDSDFKIVNDFLKNPSPMGQSLESILENFLIDFEGIGNGALEIVKGIDGKPTQLNHIPAKTIRRSKDFKVLRHKIGTEEIFYRQVGIEEIVVQKTGEIEDVPFAQQANDMIYEIKYNIFSDFYGIPDIIPAMKALLGDILQAEFNIAHFENGAIPAYMIIIEGADLDDNLEKLIQDFFKHEMKGSTAQGKTFILPVPIEGVKVQIERISPEVSEASYKIYHELSIDEVLTADGVPAVRAFVTKSSSLGRDQAKEMNRIYKESIVDPLQRRLERIINKWIVEAFGVTDWVFKLNRLSFDDREVVSLASERLKKTEALSKNEIRRFISPMIPDGLDPVEGGDDLPNLPMVTAKTHDHQDCITFKAVVDPTASVPEEALSEWDGAKQVPIREVVAVLNPIVKVFAGRLRSAFAAGEADIIRNLNTEAGGKVRVFFGGQKQIEINAVLKDFGGLETAVQTIMVEEADKAFESGVTLGAQRVGVESDFALMRPEVTRYLDQVVTPFSEKISAGLSNRIRNQLALGIQNGETLAELTKRVRTVFKSAKESRARLIARTESARAHNIGTTNQYKASRVVKAVEVSDGSDFDLPCQIADGQTWALDTAKANPIEHPNCIRAFLPIVGEPGEAL